MFFNHFWRNKVVLIPQTDIFLLCLSEYFLEPPLWCPSSEMKKQENHEKCLHQTTRYRQMLRPRH